MPRLSPPARDIASVIRRYRLNYDTFRIAAHAARRSTGLKQPSRGRHLPQLLPETALRALYNAIDARGILQHQIMLRLLFYTSVRVSELVSIRMSDVDLAASKIYIEQGKGDKDRYILFPESFRLTLAAHMQANSDNRYLFESRLKTKYSTRMVQKIVAEYAAMSKAPVHVHPHLLRHQMLTFLTKEGLGDSQIQLISGHASKKSLERYQHLGLSDVMQDYQTAVRKLEI